MNKVLIISNILLFLFTVHSFSEDDSAIIIVNPTLDDNSPTGYYIPFDLDGCFLQMDKMLSQDFIEMFRTGEEEDLFEYHFTLVLWIRNNWALWGESQLKDYFNSFEIYHPDDMSSIIITSYYRYLNDKPINLTEQIEYYIEYWKNIEEEEIENRELDEREEFEEDQY